jgi:hypothetical protein
MSGVDATQELHATSVSDLRSWSAANARHARMSFSVRCRKSRRMSAGRHPRRQVSEHIPNGDPQAATEDLELITSNYLNDLPSSPQPKSLTGTIYLTIGEVRSEARQIRRASLLEPTPVPGNSESVTKRRHLAVTRLVSTTNVWQLRHTRPQVLAYL